MTDTQVTWLTQEAHDRLKAELDQLIANRPVIAAEINDRREEGDLRENGGYHAAREEQGQQEARIRQLQELLNNAKVGEAPKQSGVALPGSVVKVYYDDDKNDTETFLIATRQEGVERRQARGVLAELAAGRRADRRQGRRDPHLHGAQRQHRQGHAGQRRALPLLTQPPPAPARYSPPMAQIAEDLFLLLLDNASAQPGLDRSRRERVLSAAVLLDLALAVPHPARDERRIRRAGPAGGAGRARCRWIPSSTPAFALLHARPLTPGRRGGQAAPSSTEDEHRRPPGAHRADPACSVADQAIQPSLRVAADQPRAGRRRPVRRCCRRCSTAAADPPTAAIISLLHAVDGLGALLSLNDRGWRWVHCRAGEIASGSWVDEYATALPEMNLAVTASAVRPALA